VGRSTLQPFEYVVPKNQAEASQLLASGEGRVRPYQGGTDLLIRIRGGFMQPERIVDLKDLDGMREIRESEDHGLVIGAACTMNQISGDPIVRERYGLLSEACESVASHQLRNRATIGGNCCNASPAADTAPALYCLGALADTFGPEGRRQVPIGSFFVGPGKTALKSGEFLTSLHLPPSPLGAVGVFNKLGRTKIGDISIASVAVYAFPGETYELQWRITLGAVGPTPLRAPLSESILAEDTSSKGIEAAVDAAVEAARPIDDLRANARYRRAMIGVMTRRGIEAVLARMGNVS
jgi:CO/xanthine dehydrogenase FAD-binding subunit